MQKLLSLSQIIQVVAIAISKILFLALTIFISVVTAVSILSRGSMDNKKFRLQLTMSCW